MTETATHFLRSAGTAGVLPSNRIRRAQAVVGSQESWPAAADVLVARGILTPEQADVVDTVGRIEDRFDALDRAIADHSTATGRLARLGEACHTAWDAGAGLPH